MYPRDVLTASAKHVAFSGHVRPSDHFAVARGFSVCVQSSGGRTPPTNFRKQRCSSRLSAPHTNCGEQLHFPAVSSHLTTAEECHEKSSAAAALHHAALGLPRTSKAFPDPRSLHYKHARSFQPETRCFQPERLDASSMFGMQEGTPMTLQGTACEDHDEVPDGFLLTDGPQVGQQAHYFSQRNGGWIVATIVEVCGPDVRLDVKSSWINVAYIRLLPPPATSNFRGHSDHSFKKKKRRIFKKKYNSYFFVCLCKTTRYQANGVQADLFFKVKKNLIITLPLLLQKKRERHY
eukprot:GEMP01067032.1.p1 GENE.GEMP01067032.1~~GEMP01067032.1.p1  ORF type:complete len:292 (+),score=45.98 GEMP01067032.1:246-1121(+)